MKNGYNRNLVYAAACIGISFFGVAMILYGSICSLLQTKLGFDITFATFLSIGILSGSVVFGPVVDRYGYKALLIVSCILVLLGLEGLTIFEKIPLLKSCILAIGFGGGVLNGLTNALASDISEEADKGSRLSFLGFCYGVGASLIPLLLATLQKYFSFESILQVIGAVMLAGIIFCMFIRYPAPKHAQGFPIKPGLALLKDGAFLILAFILFFQSGVEGICNSFSAKYFESAAGFSVDMSQILLTCMVAGLTVARLFQTAIFKKVKPVQVLPYILSVTIAGYVILLLTSAFAWAIVGMVLIGIGISATFPVILSVLGNKYAELSGTAFGMALVIALLGQTALNSLLDQLASCSGGIDYYPYVAIAGVAIMLVLFRFAKK